MTQALFVLSTGRCGTQWLAHLFTAGLGDRAVVAHEPLGDDYAPDAMLGAGDPENLDPRLAEAILEHVAEIEGTLDTRDYVECGHPLWSSLPYLLRRFAGRSRVVHLVRHPVPTAFSWLTMSAYTPPFGTHLQEKVPLSPFDAGVRFPSYRERWPALTPYEKALFYWAEVNAFALRLEREAGAPWLRVRFEDLVGGVALPRLLEFAGADTAAAPPSGVVDKFYYHTDCRSDPRLIEEHPEVVRVARELGYDPLAFDAERLRLRHAGAVSPAD
jgi:hypothetical protein